MAHKDQLDNSQRLQNLQKSELDDAQNKADFVTNWISQTEFDCSSETSSLVYTSSVVDSESYVNDVQKLIVDESKALDTNANSSEILNVLQAINIENSVQTVGGNQAIVNINSVAGPVHIGNVFVIHGPIHITDTKGRHIGVINQPGGGAIKLTSASNHELAQVEGNVRIAGESVSKKTVPMTTVKAVTTATTATTVTTAASTTTATPKSKPSLVEDHVEELQRIELPEKKITHLYEYHRGNGEEKRSSSLRREKHTSAPISPTPVSSTSTKPTNSSHNRNHRYITSSQVPGNRALITNQTAAAKNGNRTALNNVIFPVLSELPRKYYKSKKNRKPLDVIDLKSAFERAENSSPGFSHLLIKDIIHKLLPVYSEVPINTLMYKVMW